jgi:hypothetical protein
MKNEGKILFAIFKNEIHKGNAYGFDEIDAIKTHLKMAGLPIDSETINEYKVFEAKEETHYHKSEFVIIP